MPFRARNPYYLRISEKNVIPLYVYLDEHHVNWMSDSILQHVLADLQPKILPKLKAEADALRGGATGANKKPTVDTHRGDTYQFCYFFRKTEPHSVLIKTRYFSAAPPRTKPDMPPPPPPQGSKRKGRKNAAPASSNKKRKTKGKGRARDEDESDEARFSGDEDAVSGADTDATAVRRSQRSKKVVAGGYQQDGESPDSDIEMEDRPQNEPEPPQVKDEITDPRLSQTPAPHDSGGAAAPIDIDVEIEEEKPKPILALKYKDFSIYGHCLCIVVEPYPMQRFPSRASTRAPSVAPLFASRSTTPSVVGTLRAGTPLFLPDDEDRERSETPAPFQILDRASTRPPVPLFDDDDDDSDDGGGMMAFSQVMNSYNHLPAGAADDDDDLDGAVLFGDADENREL